MKKLLLLLPFIALTGCAEVPYDDGYSYPGAVIVAPPPPPGYGYEHRWHHHEDDEDDDD